LVLDLKATIQDAKFNKSMAALKLNAEWLLQMDCVKITEMQDTWLVKVPHVPMPFCCIVNCEQKYHACSCEAKRKPCSHIIATLVKSGFTSSVDHAARMKSSAFKNPTVISRKRGSKKEPLKEYFENPAVPTPESPGPSFEKYQKLETVDFDATHEDSTHPNVDLEGEHEHSKLNHSIEELSDVQFEASLSQQLLKKLNRYQRMKSAELKLFSLEENRVMVIEDSKHYGRLAVCVVSQHDIIVKTTETPRNDLITYAAKLARTKHLGLKGKVRIRVFKEDEVRESQNKKGIVWNSNDIALDNMVCFAVCCLEPFCPDDELLADSCSKCGNIVHLDCIGISLTCKVCSTPTTGIKWGEGITNTCPLDGPLQIIINKCLMHEELLTQIVKPNYKNKKVLSFLKSIKSITDSELWGNLHKEWAKATNIKGKSMYGSTYKVFWKHVNRRW